MSKQDYLQATFLKSAAQLNQLTADTGSEIAFVGRSNAGKSSALNTITNQKKLARISKTPGRTQLINIFELDEDNRLIDLPGYGYAKVPTKVRQDWQQLLMRYLERRESLKGLILLMDIRHPLKDTDWQLIEWAYGANLQVHILLTKSDKLTFGVAKNSFLKVKRELAAFSSHVSIQLFSAKTKAGLDELYEMLDSWLMTE